MYFLNLLLSQSMVSFPLAIQLFTCQVGTSNHGPTISRIGIRELNTILDINYSDLSLNM